MKLATPLVIGLAGPQLFQAQQRQLYIGKWTLNLGKSKFFGKIPKEQIQKYESQAEATTKVTVMGVDGSL